MAKRTTVLLVLDGIGITDRVEYNALSDAKTPNLDRLMRGYPSVMGLASGMAVGMKAGQAGNAKAGFMNIGAGRIVYQEHIRISNEIYSQAFFENPVLLDTIAYCKRNDSNLHLMGLLSDAGSHSHMDHLFSLLELAKVYDMKNVYVHCFTDGRDTGIDEGAAYVERLQGKMRDLGIGEIASVCGRYYAMDRDNNSDRIKQAYLAMTSEEGRKAANALEAVRDAYAEGQMDEFIPPTVIVNGGIPVGKINDDDAVIFFNLRGDRAAELTRAFCDDDFRMFKRDKKLDIRFVCLTDYDRSIENKYVAFEPQILGNTFGEYISACGMTQLRLAESEVSNTVTTFFDCGERETVEGEERLIIRSRKNVISYDDCPQMNSASVCEQLTEAIRGGRYDFILCNLPNADIVGHTADIEATVSALEEVDRCLGIIYDAVIETDSIMFVCSTHGMAEQLADYESGQALAKHTLNPVPFILINYDYDCSLRQVGCLSDVAPTLLEVMGLACPKEMTGRSLIIQE